MFFIEKNMTIIILHNDSLNNKFYRIYKFGMILFVFLVDNQILKIRVLNNSNSYYLRIIVENYLHNINDNNNFMSYI